jgi:class 3 adenylate cyclase/HAMP domain-containing protein
MAFLIILIPALALLSYADYSKASKALKNNFDFMIAQTAENISGSYDLVEVGYQILSLSLENKMTSAFEPFKKAYFEVDGVVEDIDLATLKGQLGDEFDLYIIDENGVIIHTTFEKDLNLDFSKIAPSFNEKLQKIRIESRYQGDRIASETVTGNVRKYAYWGTPDKKYILEIGIKSSEFEIPLKNLDLLQISSGFESFNPALKSVLIFNGNGIISNRPDYEIDDVQVERVKRVYQSGVSEKVEDQAENTRTVYAKVDVEDLVDAASQGDKVIELIFDTSEVENQLSSLAKNQFIITIIFASIGALLSFLLAGTITRPILELGASVKRISAGDLGTEVPDGASSTEVSTLQDGVQSMQENIQSRMSEIQTLNQSYERFVPKEFLTLLQKKKITDVVLGDSTSLRMSVLFSDMRNFTAISETMSPEQNFSFLNNYLSQVTPSITANGGFIDKYIGDAVMALFPADPCEAVKAATEMIHSLKSWSRNSDYSEVFQLDMGIGIHVGELILGTIGETDRMETTVISDTVNVSARLESLCKTYGVNIVVSGAVFNELTDTQKRHTRLIDRTIVKGKSLPIDVYEVFSADSSDEIKMKSESAKNLEKLVNLYYSEKVSEAEKYFKKILETAPKDTVTRQWSKRFT